MQYVGGQVSGVDTLREELAEATRQLEATRQELFGARTELRKQRVVTWEAWCESARLTEVVERRLAELLPGSTREGAELALAREEAAELRWRYEGYDNTICWGFHCAHEARRMDGILEADSERWKAEWRVTELEAELEEERAQTWRAWEQLAARLSCECGDGKWGEDEP